MFCLRIFYGEVGWLTGFVMMGLIGFFLDCVKISIDAFNTAIRKEWGFKGV